jgi:hypothetical protein
MGASEGWDNTAAVNLANRQIRKFATLMLKGKTSSEPRLARDGLEALEVAEQFRRVHRGKLPNFVGMVCAIQRCGTN